MAPSPSQSFSPAKDIYSSSNIYGTQGVPKVPPMQQQHQPQQQHSASNFNDYMRSSDLDDGSNRAIYVSSKMVSQQMENLSLSGAMPGPESAVGAPMYNPSPMPTNGKSRAFISFNLSFEQMGGKICYSRVTRSGTWKLLTRGIFT